LKLTHAAIHGAAFVCVVIALVAAFDSHNLAVPTPIPNMYTLHSWVGITAVVMFACQYVGGFVSYLYPGLRQNVKETYMPIHIFFGLCGFILSIAAALLGLSEKAFFTMWVIRLPIIFKIEKFQFSLSSPDYSQLPPAGLLVNCIGVCFVVFGGMVVYLTTEGSYKRHALPEDVMLLVNTEQ
jgi:cytochrome b-561